VGRLFLGGFLPGFLMGLVLMGIGLHLCQEEELLRKEKRATLRVLLKSAWGRLDRHTDAGHHHRRDGLRNLYANRGVGHSLGLALLLTMFI